MRRRKVYSKLTQEEESLLRRRVYSESRSKACLLNRDRLHRLNRRVSTARACAKGIFARVEVLFLVVLTLRTASLLVAFDLALFRLDLALRRWRRQAISWTGTHESTESKAWGEIAGTRPETAGETWFLPMRAAAAPCGSRSLFNDFSDRLRNHARHVPRHAILERSGRQRSCKACPSAALAPCPRPCLPSWWRTCIGRRFKTRKQVRQTCTDPPLLLANALAGAAGVIRIVEKLVSRHFLQHLHHLLKRVARSLQAPFLHQK